MNKKIIEKKLRSKDSSNFTDLTSRDEDWKYVSLQSDINNLELGKNTNLETTEGFDLDANGSSYIVNKQKEGLSLTDFLEIEKPVIEESHKRPVDKFLFQQITKATGGFRADVSSDIEDYFKINFQSKENTIPYMGLNIEKNKSAKFFINFGNLVESNLYPLIEINLEANSNLEMIIQVTSNHEINLINSIYAKLEKDAGLSIHMVSTGGAFSRSRIDVDLFGNGSNFNIDGVYFGENKQTHDNRVFVNHLGQNTTSNMQTKGVLGDESTSIFTGTIHIAEGATKTESHQENRNILLSEKASAQSVPNMEILCDDVICGHGSSVGPIDENLYHYVMSRGINKEKAEKLLIKGFFNEVINKDSWDIINKEISSELIAKYDNVLERSSNG
ncbi:MAG: SufD family Fe-S cluster assembly protein [Candidatus Actinomarina sp.]|nr:SufD family Fe-S cluster assembly protein [Candidatus Actinomarina sp.]